MWDIAVVAAVVSLFLVVGASLRGTLRFSLRDLLWSTALLAMGLSWLLDHAEAQRHFIELHREIVYARGLLPPPKN
jgi:hypothetical protein